MDLTGRTLGRYQLVERLGQGGMATVYKAVQPTIERLVAVKVLHSHLAASDDFVVRFKREARSLGQLQHPHIVHVIDFDVADGYYFMIVDYIPGKTLRAYLDERGALTWSEALAITTQLTEALAYAHARGTIHRDIKPGNVIFKDEASTHVVLNDFGIGKLLNDATVTTTGAMVGTPAYMSPEAVMGQRIDARADIYSLGIMLYEMVTGHVPYTGDTPMSVIMKQLQEPLPSLRDTRPDFPEPVVRLIEKALAKDPQERFQSAEAFAQAIRETQAALPAAPGSHDAQTVLMMEETIADGSTLSASTTGAESPSPRTTSHLGVDGQSPVAETGPAPQPEGGLRTPVFIAVAILVVLLGGAGLWFAFSRDDDQQAANITTAPDPAATATVVTQPTAAPTEAVAAVVPTAAPTAEPASPTAEPAPPEDPGYAGALRFTDSADVNAGAFTLQIDRVAQPPSGQHYELWLATRDGDVRNLGPLEVANNRIVLSGAADQNLIVTTDSAIISIEPDGADNSQATAIGGEIAFVGELSADYAAAVRQLLIEGVNETGALIGAREQAQVALQHTQFSLEGFDKGDLDEAKTHIEHVVNILDGESGEFYGDLNLDGQTQNPGDGFGVRAYLEAGRQQVVQALESHGLSTDQRFYAQRAGVAIETAQETLDAMIANAARLVASDTPDEARPFVEELIEQAEALANGSRDQETLPEAYTYTLAMAAIPIADEQDAAPAPDALAETVPGRVGVLRVSDSETTRGAAFLLEMTRVPTPPDGSHYDAWLISDERDATLFLGPLDLVAGSALLAGTHDEHLLNNYNRLVISVEIDGDANLRPTDAIVFTSDLAAFASPDGTQLLASESETKGAFFGAEEQLGVAMQHKDFARESLASGNLAEAKMHIEHVVNILDGAGGVHFGDLNLDGQAQNPGDGVGVRGYLQRMITAMEELEDRSDLIGNQRFFAARIQATSANGLETVEAAFEQALKVFASDTVAEAQPFVDEVERLLNEVADGADFDTNGAIDPLHGEGGLQGAHSAILGLSEASIFPADNAPEGS